MKKKIWISSEYFYPDLNFSTGYFLTGIAKKLTSYFEVNVVSELKSSDSFFPKEILYDDISIKRFSGLTRDKNNLFKRVLNFSFISIKFFFHFLTKVSKNDTLLVVTNPATMIFISSLIKKIKGCKVAIIVHDVFPENLHALGLLDNSTVTYKMLLRVFNWAYKNSDIIMVCGRDMKELFQSKIPGYKGEILFIPNWGDGSSIKPNLELKRDTLKELNIKNKFVFQFAGNLGRAQGLETLLKAISGYKNEEVHFLFFGNGLYVDLLKTKSQKSKNLTYGGFFDRKEANRFVNGCDVAIVSLSQNMKGLGVPSKTYDILAAGKPILYIGEKESEIGKIVLQYKIGYLCLENDIDSISKGFDFFANLSFDEYNNMSLRCRKVLEEQFSKEIVLEKYRNSIINISN